MRNSTTCVSLPKISVITINYNYGHFLEETINSVLNQNYPNLEYIIIDGGSSDNSLEIIKKYEDFLTYWVSEKDKGWFHAMNKGIAQATGDWLNFMNSGDTFATNQVLNKINFSAFDNYAIVYGNTLNDNSIRQQMKGVDESLRSAEIFACHQSMFFNKKKIKDQLYLNENYKIYNDYDLVLRLYKLNNEFYFLGHETTIANYRTGGISSKKSWRARYDKFRILYSYYGLKGVIYNLYLFVNKILKELGR